LANFLLKLSDVIVENIKHSRKASLESLLEQTRTSNQQQNQQQQKQPNNERYAISQRRRRI
jgi:hypothetical protein